MNQTPQISEASAVTELPINFWLVDDNKRLRTAFKELLGQFDGLRCTGTFASPNAALSALASKTGPDVILLDIQMGEACGLDAIQPIKSLSRSTQVLMLTTCYDEASKARAKAAGASDFLLKHFPINRIVSSIERAAKNPAPHRKSSARTTSPPATRPAAKVVKPDAPKHGAWMKQCFRMFRRQRA